MTVIAMTHEIGTQGRQIAAKLARRLGIDFADEHFLGHRIADRLALDRALDRERPNAQASLARTLLECRQIDDRALAHHAGEEIRELAAYGNILLRGWGAATILRDNPHVIRLRVIAPMEARTRIVGRRKRIADPVELHHLVEATDACLSSNLEPVLGPQWRDANLYQVTMSSHLLSVDECVDQLYRFVEAAARGKRRLTRRIAPSRLYHSALGPRRPRRIARAGSSPRVDDRQLAVAEQALFGQP